MRRSVDIVASLDVRRWSESRSRRSWLTVLMNLICVSHDVRMLSTSVVVTLSRTLIRSVPSCGSTFLCFPLSFLLCPLFRNFSSFTILPFPSSLPPTWSRCTNTFRRCDRSFTFSSQSCCQFFRILLRRTRNACLSSSILRIIHTDIVLQFDGETVGIENEFSRRSRGRAIHGF